MKLYNRYIFTKTAFGFGAFISIFICLIWFSRAIGFVKYITENGIKLSQFFYLFALVLPWLLLFIIPVSLFAAILLIYNRLIQSNEITILKNSGLTKIEIAKPVSSLAIICSICCYIISFYLMPYSNKQLRLSRTDLKNNYTNLTFSPQTFESLNNFTIYAKSRDEKNNLSGILLHDERSSDYSLTITAKKGNITTEPNSVLLYMENGTIQKFNYIDKNSEILNFDNYVFNLIENEKFKKISHWKAKERFLPELINPDDDSDYFEREKYIAEIHQRLTYPLLPIIFSMIAVSCILRGGFNRRGNINNIVLALILAGFFLAITITNYSLIEITNKLVPVLYLSFGLFFFIGLRMLKKDNGNK